MRLSIRSLDCRNIDICETGRLIISNYGQRKARGSPPPTEGRLPTTVKAMKRNDFVAASMRSGDMHAFHRAKIEILSAAKFTETRENFE